MVLNRHLQRSFALHSRVARPLRTTRAIPYYQKRFNANPTPGQIGPQPQALDQDGPDEDGGKGKKRDDDPTFKSTILKMMETAATTFASIAILGYVATYLV